MASRKSKSASVEDDSKIKIKHQELLQDFLVLQKECVSRKRKLKEAKEKKALLMDEIRFLTRRRNLLVKTQSQNPEQQQNGFQLQGQQSKHDAETCGRYASTSKQPFPSSRPATESMWNLDGVGPVGNQAVVYPPLRIGKKQKDLYTNGKRPEKRKISWQDPVALKV